MWEFYLAAAEMAFREQAMMVFQLQLTKRQGIVPMTRDYIAREERGCERSSAEAARRCGWRASDLSSPPAFRIVKLSVARYQEEFSAGKRGNSARVILPSHRPC